MNDKPIQENCEIINRSDAKKIGLKMYFTGVPCKHGHISKRLVSNYCCYECSKRKYINFRLENIEAERLRYREYYHKDPAKARSGTDRSKEKISSRAWFLANKKKAYDSHKDWREKNPAIIKANREKHYKTNPQAYRCYVQNRRAKIIQAGGTFNDADVKMIVERQRWKCAEPSCSVSIKSGYHIDHIMPLSLGGTNWPENIQCLCQRCNLRKHAKHPIDWARENGRLL